MLEHIDTYFNAESRESWVFIAMGIIAIAFAAYTLWRFGDLIFKGMAIPLILIGLIQLVVGGSILLRTEKQVADWKTLYQRDVGAFKQAEIPRMEKVMRDFRNYKILEVAFIVIGLLLVLLVAGEPFWVGIGLGMLVQGALMLPADIFAEKRGSIYLQQVLAQ